MLHSTFAALSSDLLKAICPKCPVAEENLLIHQNNAPSQKSKFTTKTIEKSGFSLLDHSPDLLDLAPCKLFPSLKTELRGLHFETATQLKMKCTNSSEKWPNMSSGLDLIW